MDTIEEESQDLIRDFLSKPSIEGEHIDFKAKEIVEKSEKRKKLVERLTAFANHEGGIVFIGVCETRGVQSINIESEMQRNIADICTSHTEPTLTNLLNYTPVEYDGSTVIRIDIEQAREDLFSFREDGKHKYPIREGDTTREMTPHQVYQFYNRKERRNRAERRSSPTNLGRTEVLPVRTAKEPTHAAAGTTLSDRALSVADTNRIIAPQQMSVGSFDKAALYNLSDTVLLPQIDQIRELVASAESLLGAGVQDEFTYTCKYGKCQWTAKGAPNFIEDLGNFWETLEQVERHLGNAENTAYYTANYRGSVAFGTSTQYGRLWGTVTLPARDENTLDTYRVECGLFLDDILFDTDSVTQFFSKFRMSPTYYRQRTGVQRLRFETDDVPLMNPVPLDRDGTSSVVKYRYYSADNPLYNHEDAGDSFEVPLPDFYSYLCKVDRLLFFVNGTIDHSAEDLPNLNISILDFVEVPTSPSTIFAYGHAN